MSFTWSSIRVVDVTSKDNWSFCWLFGIRFSLSIGKDLSPSKFFFLKIDGKKFDKLQNFELHTQQCVKNFLVKYEIKMNSFEIYSSKFFWNEFEYYI